MKFTYYMPLLLVIVSNLVYHNINKNSSTTSTNTFLSLAITYLVSALVAITAYLIKRPSIAKDLQDINWMSFALGVPIVGIEFGYILMYRYGWQISKGSLIASVILAVALLFIGLLFYKETISLIQFIGILFCIFGVILINLA